ncbi:MAG: ribonuclease HI [Rickettsiales bacterium]|jgi:ribonuclease HI|nr:ribonuclease HI [Rickettsiales bacterium]MDR1260897.1 ribonuclease HI [Rickettsiales bacterium]
MDKKRVIIYTDGACSGNPGPGGWAAIMIHKNESIFIKKRISGGEENTTNNKMELKAVINGLKMLKISCKVILHTDSLYVKKGITEWINKWKINGWKTADKKAVKNMELWQELDEVAVQHVIDWRWVKAHDGNVHNEEADRLARKETKKLKTEIMRLKTPLRRNSKSAAVSRYKPTFSVANLC